MRFFSLALTSLAISFFIRLLIPGVEFIQALVYALPLSIMSSAIIIPSVANLSNYKKEFLIYESTFSDILGIMVFYMIIEILMWKECNNLVSPLVEIFFLQLESLLF